MTATVATAPRAGGGGLGQLLGPPLLIALVVGALLNLVNNLEAIRSGPLDAAVAARVTANFVVPFVVATVSRLWTQRQAAHRPP